MRLATTRRRLRRWLHAHDARTLMRATGRTYEAVRRWRNGQAVPDSESLFRLRARLGLDLNGLTDEPTQED